MRKCHECAEFKYHRADHTAGSFPVNGGCQITENTYWLAASDDPAGSCFVPKMLPVVCPRTYFMVVFECPLGGTQ